MKKPIQFHYHSGIYTLETVQQLPIGMDKAWQFFSSPSNLKEITPPSMQFDVTSPHVNEKMFQGQIISYRVAPFPGIKTNWVTEITHVKDKEYFIDEQRFGPYSMWHHTHKFKEIPGGVEMHDIVNYKVPLAFFGRLAHQLMVQRRLQQIFTYRYTKLQELFGTMENRHL